VAIYYSEAREDEKMCKSVFCFGTPVLFGFAADFCRFSPRGGMESKAGAAEE
jgi:hypothetical protein